MKLPKLLIATFSLIYYILMQVLSPASFLGTVFSFDAVWLFLAAFFFIDVFFKEKISFWQSKKFKVAIRVLFSLAVIISIPTLFFILKPPLAIKSDAKVALQTEEIKSDAKIPSKYIIVLGGGITKDKKLTKTVAARLEKAKDVILENPDSIAVVTGGVGRFSPCAESEVLKRELCSLGIDENRVLAEGEAKDTIQNFYYSAILISKTEKISLDEVLASPIIVVTTKFHLNRALRLARRMGFENVTGVSSKTPAVFIPNCYAREICSYLKLNLRILLTGKPDKEWNI